MNLGRFILCIEMRGEKKLHLVCLNEKHTFYLRYLAK
jgi:hypothetical protein